VDDRVKEGDGVWGDVYNEKWNEFHNEEGIPLLETKVQKGG